MLSSACKYFASGVVVPAVDSLTAELTVTAGGE